MEIIHKIGRRKTSVARAYMSEGTGVVTINKKELSDYFPTATLQYKVNQPFLLTENEGAHPPRYGKDALMEQQQEPRVETRFHFSS